MTPTRVTPSTAARRSCDEPCRGWRELRRARKPDRPPSSSIIFTAMVKFTTLYLGGSTIGYDRLRATNGHPTPEMLGEQNHLRADVSHYLYFRMADVNGESYTFRMPRVAPGTAPLAWAALPGIVRGRIERDPNVALYVSASPRESWTPFGAGTTPFDIGMRRILFGRVMRMTDAAEARRSLDPNLLGDDLDNVKATFWDLDNEMYTFAMLWKARDGPLPWSKLPGLVKKRVELDSEVHLEVMHYGLDGWRPFLPADESLDLMLRSHVALRVVNTLRERAKKSSKKRSRKDSVEGKRSKKAKTAAP
ncbi:hypothetical protein AURDEDRAFT_165715 [Auricularia subglabra TFB-10046 SS5]|nr:hypothetical protein AURDEDRAFT_165715 [Auricularia subglabra TFB-10046 SS5]